MKHKLKVGIFFFSILFWTLIGQASLRDSCGSRFQRFSIGGFLERLHLKKSPQLKKKERSADDPALVNGKHPVNGITSSTAQTSKESQLEKKPVDLDALLRLAEQNTQAIAKLEKQSARTDQQINKLEKQSARTDQIIANFYKEFGQLHNRWGFFVEILFGDIDLLFKEIGINIPDVRSRLIRQNKDGLTKEFDIVGIGEKYIVLVETKSSLKSSDIVKFLETLKIARSFFPEYPDRKIIGVMGYVFSAESDRRFATQQGLYLIRPKANSAFIINPLDFHPKEFD